MKNHTLMQTIARANRVFGEKNNGLIVDYVGVFRDLQKALAIYGSSSGGGVKDRRMPDSEEGRTGGRVGSWRLTRPRHFASSGASMSKRFCKPRAFRRSPTWMTPLRISWKSRSLMPWTMPWKRSSSTTN